MEWKFEQFYEWAERHLNLELDAYKEKQLQRRINTVMAQSGVTSLEDYSALIQQDSAVRQQFLNYITINVTDFFRNRELFENFEEQLVTNLTPKFHKLRIWSAACSIGSEPYSLAMITEKNNLALETKILGTDIDEVVLQKARQGKFKEYELKNLPLIEKKEYFKQDGQEYILDNSIKQMVEFKQHDLIRDPYGSNYHAVICRNVTIYFKKEVKDEIYHKLSAALVPGGLLFTGATETIYRPDQFGLNKIGSFIYEKV